MTDNPQTPDPCADGMCTFGEDQAPGSGCIKPAGHDGAHCVVPGDTDAEPMPPVRYPHQDGDFTVLGPEIFTDGVVICWRGENFVRQTEPSVPVPPATHTTVEERRSRYADAVRGAGETAYGSRPFYEAITEAVLAVADAEQTELRRERDLAVAHDRQPYPTAWAYEQVCRTLRRKEAAIERVLEWVSGLDGVARQVHGSDTRHPVADHVRHLLDTQADEVQQQSAGPGRVADEGRPETREAPCGCGHPVDEHSVYGCVDGCACEWMPRRKGADRG